MFIIDTQPLVDPLFTNNLVQTTIPSMKYYILG